MTRQKMERDTLRYEAMKLQKQFLIEERMEKRAIFDQEVNQLKDDIVLVQQTGKISDKIQKLINKQRYKRSLTVGEKMALKNRDVVPYESEDDLEKVRPKSPRSESRSITNRKEVVFSNTVSTFNDR